jgi:hypothetical protein
MSQIAINTSQNVNINFNIAGVGERLLLIIDLLINCLHCRYPVFVFQYSDLDIDEWAG